MAVVAKVMPLSLIGQELVNTVEQLQANLDSYASTRTMTDMLQACIEQTDQLRGIFNLILFPAAEACCIELLELLKKAVDDSSTDLDPAAETIAALHKYLTVMQGRDDDVPQSLVPVVNNLRAVLQKAPLTEADFFVVSVNPLPTNLANQKTEPNVTVETVRRVRHMYQVGLTNVLREDNVPGSARMMLRSVENIQRYSGSSPFAYLWWVVRGVLTAISQEALRVTKPRKLLLGQLDRQFKAAELQWGDTIAQQPPEKLLKDLLYLVAMVQKDIGNIKAVQEAFNLPVVVSDKVINKLQHIISTHGVINVVSEKTLHEVAVVKDLLETGVESGSHIKFGEIVTHLESIKVALEKADMQKPVSVVDEQLMLIQDWQSSGEQPTREELGEIANAILYIESAIRHDDFDNEESDDSLDEHKDKVIADSQLADAQKILLNEAQTGLVQAIRATTAYVESDYNKGELADVCNHLKAASGGLVFMKLERGAKIVDACIAFFEKEVFASEEKLNQQKLDAIADALTAMEYYLGGLLENKRYGEGMLDVAEEGLHTLGYLAK